MKSLFIKSNPDYPNSSAILHLERCVVSDNDIPGGNGGINREQYSYGQLRHQPIIPELLEQIKHTKVYGLALDCNARNQSSGFQMFRVNGEYCFWGLRLAPIVKTPSIAELKQLLAANIQTATALNNRQVIPRMIRDITYNLLREELARICGVSFKEASHIIGNVLDCAPHEDPCGYIFMVPNWAHNWFRHDGYVKQMLAELNT